MSRIRTIKPEFWQDEDVGALSPNARLLFIASWNTADDEGLLTWTPAFIRAQAFAYDESTLDDVRGYMDELTKGGFIHRYKDGKGKEYGWIINFRKHQKIDKPQPSKHPLPSIQNPEIRKAYAERDNWTCHICEGEIDAATNDKSKCLSLDHVGAKSRGGLDAPSNIRAAHFGCNASKKDGPFDEGSTNDLGIIDDHSPMEGKVREGSGKEGEGKGKELRSCTKPRKPRLSYPQDFEDFWSAYPTDPLMSKKDAGAQWSKLTPEDRDVAMKAVPGFLAYCRATPEYRPVHACRFLSQRRFEGFAEGAVTPLRPAAKSSDDDWMERMFRAAR